MNFSKKFLRVMSLALMVLILIPAMPSHAATFSDVNSNHWAYSYIEKMAKLKFITGYDDGTFKPKSTLTYLETIQLLSKLLNISDSEVKASKEAYGKLVADLKVVSWAQEAVMKCLYKGVITEAELKSAASKDMIRVGTNKRVGRLDISIYMAKAMGLEEEANSKAFVSLTFKDLLSIKSEYHKLLYVLIDAGVLSANGTGNGYFEPSSPLLREQMAKMMSAAYDYLQKNPQDSKPVENPESADLVVGNIIKITNLGENTFLTVKDKSNKEAAYLVDSNTSIRLDGKTVKVNSLYEGQVIEITIKKGTSTAVSIEAESHEEKLTGTIKSILPISNKLEVEYKKGSTTNTIQLIVDNNSEIELNGKDADLYDLKKGDEVSLVISNNLVLELKATTQFGDIEGTIVDIDSKKFITVENSKGIETEYEVDEDVSIHRNGRKADFSDLRVGDEVELELEYGLIVDIDAEVVEKDIEGYITAISSRLNTGTEITIKNRKTNKEETYTLSRNATIEVDGETATTFSLNVGYFVEAVVGSDEIIEMEADSVGAESMIRGKITKINTRRKKIELDILSSDLPGYTYGDNIEIKLSDDVIITEGSYDDLDIDDLKRRMTVYIFGYYDGSTFMANEINIR